MLCALAGSSFVSTEPACNPAASSGTSAQTLRARSPAVYHDVNTTGTFEGLVTGCFAYDDAAMTPAPRGRTPAAPRRDLLGIALDAAGDVEPATVRLGIATIWSVSRKGSSFVYTDVDLDGDVDLVAKIAIQELGLSTGAKKLAFTGRISDGTPICGTDDALVK